MSLQISASITLSVLSFNVAIPQNASPMTTGLISVSRPTTHPVKLKTARSTFRSKQLMPRRRPDRTDHPDRWLQEPMPFILIFYHAQEEIAYWYYLQAQLSELDQSKLGKTYTVYVEKQNILDESAVLLFATYKNQVLHQIQESFRHEI
jgi:hypothetical protein